MAETNEELIGLTVDVVSAFAANNSLSRADLAGLIESTHAALLGLGKEPEPAAPEKPVPMVSIKRSITPDFITCLEDGKKFKSLKRHLRAAYGMSPEQYRTKWGLPPDYPMVAPAYAEARSTLAKTMGLGRSAAAAATKAAGTPAKAKRVARAKS